MPSDLMTAPQHHVTHKSVHHPFLCACATVALEMALFEIYRDIHRYGQRGRLISQCLPHNHGKNYHPRGDSRKLLLWCGKVIGHPSLNLGMLWSLNGPPNVSERAHKTKRYLCPAATPL